MSMMVLELDWPNKTVFGAGSLGFVWANPNNHKQPVMLPDILQNTKDPELWATIISHLPDVSAWEPSALAWGNFYATPFNYSSGAGNWGAGITGFALGNTAPNLTGTFAANIHIFTVDENGDDIEEISLGPHFIGINSFPITGKLICGFRGTITLENSMPTDPTPTLFITFDKFFLFLDTNPSGPSNLNF